jgi:hypothetical protein
MEEVLTAKTYGGWVLREEIGHPSSISPPRGQIIDEVPNGVEKAVGEMVGKASRSELIGNYLL